MSHTFQKNVWESKNPVRCSLSITKILLQQSPLCGMWSSRWRDQLVPRKQKKSRMKAKCKKLLHKPLEEGNSCQRSTVATCCNHPQDHVTLQDFLGDFVLHHFVATWGRVQLVLLWNGQRGSFAPGLETQQNLEWHWKAKRYQTCVVRFNMLSHLQIDLQLWTRSLSGWKHTYITLPYDSYTRSTAQGGGGSFRNWKPIGEVGCCESRMAERIHWWTERWLELCFLEWLQSLQWSPHSQLLDVVWCSAVAVVVVVVAAVVAVAVAVGVLL